MARVLVIDDDPLIRSAIRAWFAKGDFEVVLADGGVAGLNALEASAFDVVVVDIFMPGMDGFESIQKIHRRAPRVPIIAMSGLTFSAPRGPAPDFLRMAVTLGAAYCLRKPFKPRELLKAVESCLSKSVLPLDR